MYTMLPLTSDLEESRTVNRYLVLAVNNKNAFVVGNE